MKSDVLCPMSDALCLKCCSLRLLLVGAKRLLLLSIHLLPEASSTRSGRLRATASSSSRGVLPPDCVISVMRFSSTKLRQRPWCRYPYPDSRIPVSKPSDTRIHLSNAVSVDPDTYPTRIRPYQRRIVSICVSDTRYAADVPCLCIVDHKYLC
ncbi:hypothetical protein C1H46_022699 [Malus baccata]|uniref:Uncharacterized protein n=1 Tax=Malus baccata TaxID=106549 RepID=A0A540LZ49_MALBA|nr:hypothetical protein C1H46_022699 [Malus baccata]